MKVKLFFIIVSTFIILDFSISQTTFLKDLKMMNFITQPGSLVSYDDTILCVGNGVDHNPYRDYGVYVAKFDLEGNMVNRYVDYNGDYSFYGNHSSIVEDDKLIIAGDVLIRDPLFQGGVLMVVNIATGEFEKRIIFSNAEGKSTSLFITDLVRLDSITFAILSSIDEKENKHYRDAEIIIVNIETEEVKYIQIGKKDVDDDSDSFIWDGKKFLVGTGIAEPPYDIFNPYKKRNSHGLIYEVDTSGKWDVVYTTEEKRNNLFRIRLNEDGSIVCISTKIKYDKEAGTGNDIWNLRYIVMKLDKDYNLLWEKPIGLDLYFHYYSGTAEILPSIEGDGYVIAGFQPNFAWNATEETFDSMKKSGVNPMLVGILQKISENGDSIWMRSYSYINDTSSRLPEHALRDIIYSPDGGYTMAGELIYRRRPGIDTVSNFHSWLVKVDQYGCLIPGCQGDDTTKVNNPIPGLKLLIYPNPTSDKLYVFQEEGERTKYVVSDIYGKMIIEWEGGLASHTYIIDVSKYKKGVYVISEKRIGRKPRSGKFVVE